MSNNVKRIQKYNEATYKRAVMWLRKDEDADVIKKLEEQESKNAYIKRLIREDIKNTEE